MKKIFIILLLAFAVFTNAQVQNQGEVIYEEVSKVKYQMTEEQKAKLKQMDIELPSSFKNEMKLLFTSKEAIYTTVEKDEMPEVNQGGGVRMSSMKTHSILYQDLENNEILEQKEFMTRQFLIVGEEDEKPQWKISNERKEILGYQCQKALLEIKPKKEDDKNSKEPSMVEAWFTMQIPVSLGPDKYKGLPGLILELKSDLKNGGSKITKATQINLRKLNDKEIIKPEKGKKVSREKFKKIVEEKLQEIQENKGSGNFTIIGK